jgi:hypothetical protein
MARRRVRNRGPRRAVEAERGADGPAALARPAAEALTDVPGVKARVILSAPTWLLSRGYLGPDRSEIATERYEALVWAAVHWALMAPSQPSCLAVGYGGQPDEPEELLEARKQAGRVQAMLRTMLGPASWREVDRVLSCTPDPETGSMMPRAPGVWWVYANQMIRCRYACMGRVDRRRLDFDGRNG